MTLRPIAYGTGLTLSTDGKLRAEPDAPRNRQVLICERMCGGWSINEGETSFCLNNDGHWEREPPVYSRDEAFYARCRLVDPPARIEFGYAPPPGWCPLPNAKEEVEAPPGEEAKHA